MKFAILDETLLFHHTSDTVRREAIFNVKYHSVYRIGFSCYSLIFVVY